MGSSDRETWKLYRQYLCVERDTKITLDFSRVGFTPDYFSEMAALVSSAVFSRQELEFGALANGTEQRMVGHYWLRAPALAPSEQIATAIENEVVSAEAFAERIRSGILQDEHGAFRDVVHVGIGGSALGPQLMCDSLGTGQDRVAVHFLDNSDPDGIDRLLSLIHGALGTTLVSVVSKSGWTPTTMQVVKELRHAYDRAGVDFSRHATATTMEGTALDATAGDEGWLARFRLWPWVGGRTSVTSAVGLLPAALTGVDIRAFLDGAARMDRATRQRDVWSNPAMLLALAWHRLGHGRGDKDMVILPYRDRLSLFPRYVQQLVMESIGKKCNRRGQVVHQGLTVYGNKGSTDQHAYVQQLRDGLDNFFVTFIHVGQDRARASQEVAPGLTLGDYLFGHMEGTRNALFARGRQSITIELPDLSPRSLGALIALYERAVGLYAEFINVNAYDQPGVDKDAAAIVVELQRMAMAYLETVRRPQSAEQIAAGIGRPNEAETVFKVLRRLAADPRRGIHGASWSVVDEPAAAQFEWVGVRG